MRHWRVKIKIRHSVLVLLFFGSFTSSVLRVNFSMILMELTKPPKHCIHTDPICVEHAQNHLKSHNETRYDSNIPSRYRFSHVVEGLVVCCYYLGFCASQILSKPIVNKFGSRIVGGASGLIAGIFTITGPVVLTELKHQFFMASRFAVGFFSGFLFDSFYMLMIRWAPIQERSFFFKCFFGGHVGIFLSYLTSGWMLFYCCWHGIAYLSGFLAIIWSIIFYCLIANQPSEHKFITQEELEYILDNQEIEIRHNLSEIFPRKRMLTSQAVLALFVNFLAHYWNYFFFLDYLPVYLYYIMHLSVLQVSYLLTSVLFLRVCFGLVCVQISKYYYEGRSSKHVTHVRKGLTVVSHLLPGIILATQAATKCNQSQNIWLIVIAIILNGGFFGAALLNPADITPHFGADLAHYLHCITSFIGTIMPFIVIKILQFHSHSLEGWFVILTVNSAIYIVGGIVFIIFGSGAPIPWDASESRTNFLPPIQTSLDDP